MGCCEFFFCWRFIVIYTLLSMQIFGSTSSGTFLIILGIDLLLNRQEGMSRGLRFLFDRNSNHLLVRSGSS